MDERRGRSRIPLRVILAVVLAGTALWLTELYMDPTWAKIRSFVLGYFVGSFIMEWISQRSSRERVALAPAVAPATPAAAEGASTATS